MPVGVIPQLPMSILPGNVTPDVAENVVPVGQGVYLDKALRPSGSYLFVTGPTYATGPFAGFVEQLFGQVFFGKVHIIPSKIILGFVLSEITRSFEVWNATKYALTLEDITFVNGGAGMFIETGPQPVAHYPTSESNIYTLRITTDGTPIIAETALFDFVSVIADLDIEGQRLVAFSISPDWQSGITETIGYTTDVLTAYDDTEQRRQLRAMPWWEIGFNAIAMEARDSALLHAILYDWQTRAYGVPLWQDIGPLLADVSPGAINIQVNTADRQYEAGGLAYIWRSPHEWEAFQISGVNPLSIDVVAPAQQQWTRASGAFIMPMRSGRLSDKEALTRISRQVSAMQVSFHVDGVVL